MKSRRLALVTCAAQRDLYAEEAALLPMLGARGVDARAVVWDDASVDWGRFDAVVIRSTWDYFERYAEFRAWIDRVEESGAPLWNPPSLVRWNLDKRYLRELADRGARIVPTAFCDAGERASLSAILEERGWPHAIMKPAISGGAYRTHRVSAHDAATHQGEMDAILATTGVLVQPFFPEIQSEGEWSLAFFDGAFSHAVLKVPAGADYRVQPQFGGTFTRVAPEEGMLAQAQAVLRALPEPAAYARIDGVRRGQGFYLMEAELIEPYLYMSAAPDAPERYVALLAKLAGFTPAD